MVTPSGLSDGTSHTMTLSSIARVAADVSVARRWAIRTGERWPPTSVEWMLDVMSTTVLPFRSASTASGFDRSARGSASLALSAR
jgi:hypothetical protein